MRSRHTRILDYIQKNGFATADDLARILDTSAITVRRDFIRLENEKLLTRVHGGAIPVADALVNMPVVGRMNYHMDRKFLIAAKAAGLLKKNDTIFLDAGSTCALLAENIPEGRSITVITHSLQNLAILKNKTGVKTICPGGEYNEKLGAFTGSVTDSQLQKYFVDRAFIGAAAISIESGCSINNHVEATIKAVMNERSRQPYILADASKFSNRAFYSVIPVEKIRAIITDDSIDEETVALYGVKGIQMIISSPDRGRQVVKGG